MMQRKAFGPCLMGFFIFALQLQNVLAVRRTKLIWVNGIGYNADHMTTDAPKISLFFGGKRVEFYHNPTSMTSEDDFAGYYRDLTQAGTQKFGRITQEVEGLVQHLKDAIKSVGRNGRVIHIAHSQGALVTSLAAKQLTPLEMNQIEVLAFGGAAVLRSTAETPFRRCINYYSVNDPLLWVAPSAEQALRSGFVVDEEFCFLAPRIGDPIADHHLLGPTYAQALAWEGQRYQRLYQSTVQRALRFILLIISAIVKVILQRCFLLWVALLQKLDRTLRPLVEKVVHLLFVVLFSFLQMTMHLLERKRMEPSLGFGEIPVKA